MIGSEPQQMPSQLGHGILSTRPSCLQNLRTERARLQERIDDLDKAISALESHPELEQVLTTVANLGRY